MFDGDISQVVHTLISHEADEISYVPAVCLKGVIGKVPLDPQFCKIVAQELLE